MSSTSKRPPLDAKLVDRLFDRLQGLYGSLWLDRWRTGETMELPGGAKADKGMLLAKAQWAMELSGFADKDGQQRIAKAIDACRHRTMPPTLPEFLELCRQQPNGLPPLLKAPHPDAPARQRNMAEVQALIRRMTAA
ncbi:hypothetical protein [Methyloversatilis sp. XJ19-49]|uniref:hypothetical protein n=1 Tax=Methyloversatilis sp. XJ19-49 TaxID=2963429 RepID=UPI00211C8DB6|nr:hypothetical protein [Methyloversatilis sp. XJ19-49]MCQ9378823.1 hypothetical protein [Methyloversatilis sp. XJ19-49]